MEDKPNMNVVEATLAIMIKFIPLQLALTIIGSIISEQIKGSVYYITLITFTLSVFITSYFARDQLHPGEKEKFISVSTKTKAALFLILYGVGVIDIIVIALLRSFLSPNEGYTYEDLYGNNGELIFSIILCGGILQPIMEEYFFRGKVLRGLLRYGYCPALIASSIVFSIAHFDIIQALSHFIFGVSAGILFLVSGNIVLSAAFHCATNLIVHIVQSLVYSDMQVTCLLTIGIVSIILSLAFICLSKTVRTEIVDVFRQIFKKKQGELDYEKNSCNSGEQ